MALAAPGRRLQASSGARSPAGSVANPQETPPGAWSGAGAAAERGRQGTAKEVLELPRIYFFIGFPRILRVSY